MSKLAIALAACTLIAAVLVHLATAKTVEYTFTVGNHTVERLCQKRTVVTINKLLPGPIIRTNEGDTLLIHVNNESPYDLTLHWHGVFQRLSCWPDGPSGVTQCPIRSGNNFTYRFNVTGQEGTLWYHAHVSWLRVTVHGALIIRPRKGRAYPFPRPHREFPIILGEWWNTNVVDVETQGLVAGVAPNISDAFTINGMPGPFYPCSSDQRTHAIKVIRGQTYLLRIINAALNTQLFFKIAHHFITVVAIDAAYTEPYPTDVVVVAPGNTVDVLLTADQAPGRYYMVAQAYASVTGIAFDNTTATGVLIYEPSSALESTPVMPDTLPEFNDTDTANQFYTSLTSLSTPDYPIDVPTDVDERMFVTFGFGLMGSRIAASMNNLSFVLPASGKSLLEAHYHGISGTFASGFPDEPPMKFDYSSNKTPPELWQTEKATRVKVVSFNSTVEMVLQNTGILTAENHPIHLHGYNFYVLGQGFGNYLRERDEPRLNLINPQIRNTIGVPAGGWAVIRFRADNPGVWFMHCHLEVHVPWGLGTVLLVKNGPTPATTLPPPPPDYPQCA